MLSRFPGNVLLGKNHNGCASRQRNRSTAAAGGHRDILLAVLLICEHATGNRTTGVEAVQRVPTTRIKREEVAIKIAGEEHPASRGGDCCVHGRLALDRQAILPVVGSTALIHPAHLSIGSLV